jgi:hypothetical protein
MNTQEEIQSLRRAYEYCENVFLTKEMTFELEQLYHMYPSIVRAKNYTELMGLPNATSGEIVLDASVYSTSTDYAHESITITVNSSTNNKNFWVT